MEKQEFNLSEKITGKAETKTLIDPSWIYTRNVKEFIRLLKERLNVRYAIVPVDTIDKLAGDRLNGK